MTPTPTPSATRAVAEKIANEFHVWALGDDQHPETFKIIAALANRIATALATAEAAGWKAGAEMADMIRQDHQDADGDWKEGHGPDHCQACAALCNWLALTPPEPA